MEIATSGINAKYRFRLNIIKKSHSAVLVGMTFFVQGMTDWVRMKEPKRFSEFGTQRYWSKPDLTFEEIE